MQAEDLVLSVEPATDTYPEPDESNPYSSHRNFASIFNIIVSPYAYVFGVMSAINAYQEKYCNRFVFPKCELHAPPILSSCI
jgi:hypothetical protein